MKSWSQILSNIVCIYFAPPCFILACETRLLSLTSSGDRQRRKTDMAIVSKDTHEVSMRLV